MAYRGLSFDERTKKPRVARDPVSLNKKNGPIYQVGLARA
jgi:hypothetical protein